MKNDAQCRCGHMKIYHREEFCNICWDIFSGLDTEALYIFHPFQLDNLKYLEELSK